MYGSGNPVTIKMTSTQRPRRTASRTGLCLLLLLIQLAANALEAAQLAATSNQPAQQADLELDGGPEVQSGSQAPEASIVINSIEAEQPAGPSGRLQASAQQVGNRHRYEQAPTSTEPPQVAESALGSGQQEVAAKIEPRSTQEPEQASQTAREEPVIIDHRPGLTEPPTSTQTPVSSSTTASSQQPQLQPQPLPPQQVAAGGGGQQASGQWTASQQSGGSQANSMMMSSSNQVVAVQHPTSINAIISEQQQPQAQAAGSQQPAQVVSLNGQPVTILLNPSTGQGQLVPLSQGARRISISGWLRGLSSMLSNIFNRREHGQGQQQVATAASGQLQPAGSSPSGHWIQLGPNAPHWLTQAQSALQQFQQQQQQVGASRFASFMQPLQGLSGAPNQIQLQAQPSTATIAIALPQQMANTGGADLQASGSSTSYVTMQPAQAFQTAGQLVVGQMQTSGQPQSVQQAVAVAANPGQQQQLVKPPQATQQQAAMSAPHQPTRVGRSSKSAPSKATGNLPLAHYSEYASAGDSEW